MRCTTNLINHRCCRWDLIEKPKHRKTTFQWPTKSTVRRIRRNNLSLRFRCKITSPYIQPPLGADAGRGCAEEEKKLHGGGPAASPADTHSDGGEITRSLFQRLHCVPGPVPPSPHALVAPHEPRQSSAFSGSQRQRAAARRANRRQPAGDQWDRTVLLVAKAGRDRPEREAVVTRHDASAPQQSSRHRHQHGIAALVAISLFIAALATTQFKLGLVWTSASETARYLTQNSRLGRDETLQSPTLLDVQIVTDYVCLFLTSCAK